MSKIFQRTSILTKLILALACTSRLKIPVFWKFFTRSKWLYLSAIAAAALWFIFNCSDKFCLPLPRWQFLYMHLLESPSHCNSLFFQHQVRGIFSKSRRQNVKHLKFDYIICRVLFIHSISFRQFSLEWRWRIYIEQNMYFTLNCKWVFNSNQ